MQSGRNPYLAAAAICGSSTTEGAFRQGNVLDDLGKVQIDLQQQVLAPLTHRTTSHNKQKGLCIIQYDFETSH